MSQASQLIAEGMYGQNLQRAVDSIRYLQDSSPLIWFVVFKTLQRINDEWDEEILPIERADQIEKRFQGRLVALLEKADRFSRYVLMEKWSIPRCTCLPVRIVAR